MLTLILRLARRFDRRLSLAFGVGVVAGVALLAVLLAAHLRHACGPVGVPGFVLCKVA